MGARELTLAHITAGGIAVVLGLSAPLGAQALPAAAELVAKHTAAIGGRAALANYTTMHEASVTSVSVADKVGPLATTDVYRRRPDMVFLRSVHGPAGAKTESLQGFDGTTAWIIASANSPPMIPERALAGEVRRHANFLAALDDITAGKKLTTVSRAEFEGQKCFKVKFTSNDAPGEQGFEYFDVETGLFAGLTVAASARTGRAGVVETATDYKDFGGMKFATRTVTRSGRNVATRTITSIEFDTTDSTVFALPDAVKALVKR